MSAKIFLDSSIKYVPQMDILIQYTENGGIEATQSFEARKADIGSGSNLNNFRRGVTWETVYPEVPVLYRFLTMKTFDPQDSKPGMVLIKATFTGTQFAANSSSGEEDSIPTSSLRGNLEQVPIQQSKAWRDLSAASRDRLNVIMAGGREKFSEANGFYGYLDDFGTSYSELTGGMWARPTGNELLFAIMIAEGQTTMDYPSWNYNFRTESKTGFTSAQLAALGKIIASPLGNPTSPGADWTWQLVGPNQDQSGQDRFVKDLNYKLIPNTARNRMLYAL